MQKWTEWAIKVGSGLLFSVFAALAIIHVIELGESAIIWLIGG